MFILVFLRSRETANQDYSFPRQLIPLALLQGGDNLVGLRRYPYEVEEIFLGLLVDIVGCVGYYDDFATRRNATRRDAAREKSRRPGNGS